MWGHMGQGEGTEARGLRGVEKDEGVLEGAGAGLEAREWEAWGRARACLVLTLRYCRRASSSAFRMDVPYRVSSLKDRGDKR